MTQKTSTIGKRLSYIIAQRQIKPSSIASALNVSRSAVSHWRNKGNVSIKHLPKLCQLLGVSITWLLTGRSNSLELKPQVELTNQEEQFILWLRKQSYHDRNKLLTFFELAGEIFHDCHHEYE